jgi:hypothetical protein
LIKDDNDDLLADSYSILKGGIIALVSYRIYMGLSMLGSLEYMQLSH